MSSVLFVVLFVKGRKITDVALYLSLPRKDKYYFTVTQRERFMLSNIVLE